MKKLRTLALPLLILLPPLFVGPAQQTASGVANVQFFMDGAPFGPQITMPKDSIGNYEYTGPITPGIHNWYARATDIAGNAAQAQPRTFTAVAGDTTAPVVEFVTTGGTSFDANAKEIKIHVTDNDRTVLCDLMVNGTKASSAIVFTINGKLPATVSLKMQQSTIPKGNYTLDAACRDTAGNVGSAISITVIRK